ncbi:MAG: hypothetical protein EON60_00425 [Alphaproteobacteria bacterium]|nr:MAG: hypothetical protein EON60_00425 [Alphaproteobacteria bacterium]
MAKVGLAAELAKQAAAAARDELAAAEGTPAPRVNTPKAWTVPVLADDFMLDAAMERAATRVTGHYRQVLAPQGLMVELKPGEPAVPREGDMAGAQQVGSEMQANLREQQSGRLVKAYTAPALLALFATQQQATGIVVDGQV